MDSSYEQKHPLYAASSNKRRKAMDLYEGGERIEGNRAYLTRHTYESDKQYDIRASRATYRNFAAPIVDVFASFISEGRPERILPDALRPIEADADRYGMTADAFFADVTRLAAAGGARFVIVDMEQKKGETVAEDRASGRRLVPYFTSISPDDVWDWGMDAKGLAWAVVHSEEMEHPAAFAAPLRYETLTVWTRDSWTRYRRPMKDKENTGYAIAEDGERRHGLGAVPLVPFLFEPTSPMTGLPATDDVLSLILRIYRRDSELDKMLFDRAVPLLNAGGVSQEHRDTFVVASSNALMSTEPGGITAQYVGLQASRFRRRPKPLPATRPACGKSPFAWSVHSPPWESPPSPRPSTKHSSTRSLPASPGAAAARKPSAGSSPPGGLERRRTGSRRNTTRRMMWARRR